jgi:hypothetical protein
MAPYLAQKERKAENAGNGAWIEQQKRPNPGWFCRKGGETDGGEHGSRERHKGASALA